MKILERIGPTLLVCFSIGISIVLAYTATKRSLTVFETVLWQIFVFAGGLTGSYIFGKRSAQEAAKEIIKPHARSAFRRLFALYQSLRRAANAIEFAQQSDSDEDHQVAFAKLETVVIEQLAATDDALEEWRDIVPEDVEELTQNRDLITQGEMNNDRTD